MREVWRARSCALAFGVLAAAGSASANPAPLAGEPSCYAACRGAGCKLVGTEPGVAAKELDANYAQLASCDRYVVQGAPVALRYRHQGQWFIPPSLVKPDENTGAVFARYKPDPCAVPRPACLQARMATKVAAVGGHGIDGQASTPAGAGDPCRLGLPCGRILIPREPWRFRLADAAQNGQLTLRIARGAPPPGVPPEFTVEVVNGLVTVDGEPFSPGASYVYRYVAFGGAQASGEFSVLARPLMVALRSMAAKRVAEGQDEELAWIDTLAANDLDWDAWQAVQIERR